jgi:hypothetical protein
MAVRSMTAPADGQRPAPLLTVMVDYPTLAGRVCQLAGSGTVIAPGDITALLGQDDTLIERVVFDGPNRVRDISSSRTFRGTLRRALEITHPRCDHPTCHVPAKHCQGDHIVPWSEGGETSQDNGRMGCGFHNRLWYRRPDLRPPPRHPTFTPHTAHPPDTSPATADPPGANEPDQPGLDPVHAGSPDDDLPAAASRDAVDTVDHRTARPSHGPCARRRPPDLIIITDDATIEFTVSA